MAEASAVALLRPIRVLVAGDDAAVVNQLHRDLLRLGFHAMSTTRMSCVADLAAVERVNVVVLEISGGLGAAASLASSLEALPHRTQVLFAGGPARAITKLGYARVDPAGSPEDLAAAVHDAYRGVPRRVGRASRA
ncbi:MAG TPA: hypothetical protein VFL73_09990 [Solirubrobacteraceae bacterium]|nr:hypothetical protein [Solirubrobacteraceae bacterium]